MTIDKPEANHIEETESQNDGSHDTKVSDKIEDSEKKLEENKIEYEKYRSLLDEKKKTQAERDEYKDKLKHLEEQKLIEQNRYKELYESRQKELEEIKSIRDKEKLAFVEQRKLQAFIESVGGLKRQDYVKFIDTDKIIVESDGSFNKDSLQEYVESFKHSFPELLKQSQVNTLPSDSPKVDKRGKINLKNKTSKEILELIKRGK